MTIRELGRLESPTTMAGMLPPFASFQDDGLIIRVLVVPGASRAGIIGPHGDRLKIRVVAPPEGGKANQAAADLIATWLGCRQASVVSGHGSRRKAIFVPGARSIPGPG